MSGISTPQSGFKIMHCGEAQITGSSAAFLEVSTSENHHTLGVQCLPSGSQPEKFFKRLLWFYSFNNLPLTGAKDVFATERIAQSGEKSVN